MSQFLYYLPGTAAATKDQIVATLPHAGFETGYSSRATSAGPDGKGGLLVARASGVEYDAQKQAWAECNGGKWWAGYALDAPPGPADLLRAEPLTGHKVKLADGREWLVPVLFLVKGLVALPSMQVLRLNAEGEWTSAVKPEHEELARRVRETWDHWAFAAGIREQAPDEQPPSFEFELDLIIDGLALNYHLSRWEVSLLGLLDAGGNSYRNALEALIDVPTLKAIAQKKTTGGFAD